jgi:hypothetical protein
MASQPYTPTERRILALLSDGFLHSKNELRKCLNDDLSEDGVKFHIWSLRKKLKGAGQDISHVVNGVTWYCLVRHVSMKD